MNLAKQVLKMHEAKDDWSKGIVFGNALNKAEAQDLVKNFKMDAKGAYPKLDISFKIVKIKDDSYGVEAKIANNQPKDMEFDAYARMHGNAKKDIKSMLTDEIKKMQSKGFNEVKGKELKVSDLKFGNIIQSKKNPEWGTWVIKDRTDHDKDWWVDIQGDSGSKVLYPSEVSDWILVKK